MNNIRHYRWMRQNIVSLGYSSSKIRIMQGRENKEESRRVEFRVVTNAEEKLYELIKRSKYAMQDKEVELLTSNESSHIEKLDFRR